MSATADAASAIPRTPPRHVATRNSMSYQSPSQTPPNHNSSNTHTFRAASYNLGSDEETLSNTLANSISHPASRRLEYPEAPLAAPAAGRPAKFNEEWEASQRGSSIVDGLPTDAVMQRPGSISSSVGPADDRSLASPSLSRGNTLKKKPSLRRGGSLRRSSSRRSMKAGSVRSLALQSSTDDDEIHSAFYCPVHTSGSPTETLAARFQAWRKILKDLVSYFREIQSHYEHRAKSLQKLANVLNSTSMPPGFLASGGLDDAFHLLRSYNKQAISESLKAKEIEEDVILALTGLRSDLRQKIKEIKNLSGDFKNSVDKEMDATRKAVNQLQDSLGQSELDPALTTGKQDPYLLRLVADRQLERQIDEENYLHQAYLNLETSGRELESIVVGEIQKSYNAYAGILKRESDLAHNAVEELRVGPIAMPKGHEWSAFVEGEDQLVDPEVPIRSADQIHYPGRDHYACQEIRAGLLERKSKYLKSYTAGWYILSPTHLHEFKSADKAQAPIMSLYLPEQKLGSHSTEGGSSNKFVLKGRQTGGLHRGHTWVFRAESHDTMMAWYEDIKALTEKSPEERNNFVRVHSRSFSRSSQRSASSDGLANDDDDEPFAARNLLDQSQKPEASPRRPEPGGRFPSDLQIDAERGLHAPLSPSSISSGFHEDQNRDAPAARTTDLPEGDLGRSNIVSPHIPVPADASGLRGGYGSAARIPIEELPSHAAIVSQEAQEDGVNPYTSEPIRRQDRSGCTDDAMERRSHLGTTGSARYRGLGNQETDDVVSNNSSSQIWGNPTPGSYTIQANGKHAGTDAETTNYVLSSMVGQPQQQGQQEPPAPPTSNKPEPTPLVAGERSCEDVGLTNAHGMDTTNKVVARPPRWPSNTEELPGTEMPGNGNNEGLSTSHLHIPGEYPKATPIV